MTRPFRILGLQQIAVGAADKERLRKLWVDLLGLTVTGTFRNPSENVDEYIATLGGGPTRVEVDLMEPIDPIKKPAVHDPALNHVGLWVDDLRAAVEWLGAQGVRFTPGGIRKGAGGFDICFVHPKGSLEAPPPEQRARSALPVGIVLAPEGAERGARVVERDQVPGQVDPAAGLDDALVELGVLVGVQVELS